MSATTKKANTSETQVTLYLDTRRKKDKSHKYPVKLRIWHTTTKKAKLYFINEDLTESEFQAAWLSQKVRTEYSTLNKKLKGIVSNAEEIADNLKPFTFDTFETKFFRKSGDEINVYAHYDSIIKELTQNEQLATASSYGLSKKSLKDFSKWKIGRESESLTFYDITPKWLSEYEDYMLKQMERSETTISIYLRVLRAVFNRAIKGTKDIDEEIYPFGEKKNNLYSIPTGRKVKKALNAIDLKALNSAVPLTLEQEKAKDFWFFSYGCFGINIKDIVSLKYKDLNGNSFSYYRAKTKSTKSKPIQIDVHLNDYAQSIINKYGNQDKTANNYVFSVLDHTMSAIVKRQRIQAFTRFINQHMKKICENNNLPIVSTYWARHSFATNSIRKGASMEFMQAMLGHSSQKTTQDYFGGFEDKTVREFADNLMNF
jgi:integrase/recombinase XerD